VNIKRIDTPDEGNSNYPLPADYYDLSPEGMRLARCNACRQWLLKFDNKERKADAYVASLWFWDKWYLWPDEDADFNPLFYDDEPCESPDYHWMIARQWIMFRKNATMAPRGGAKSKFNQKDILLRNTTRPAYSFVYATSTHPNARDTGECLKRQWLFNERIHDDWAKEFPDGRMIPKRGEGSFATEHMILTNGSWVRLLSSQSRQRGARPRRYRLDDPEYDPKANTSMTMLRDYIKELLFKLVIPMVTRPDTGVDWIGTYVSKRHMLWHAMQTIDTPEGPRAKDPRFDRWSRLEVPAALEDKDGNLVSCWKEMWPATIKEKMEMAETNPAMAEHDSLEEIKLDVGAAIFNSEFLGRPGDSDETYFVLDTEERGKHSYWFQDIDHLCTTSPTTSATNICWYETVGESTTKRVMPLKEFLTEYTRSFMPADTSYTSSKDSDYKGVAMMCVTPNNDLFVLDLWLDQCKEMGLVKAIFTMADLWKCPTVHPEVVKSQVSLYNALNAIVNTRAKDMAGVEHLPAIKALKVGMTEKVAKISGLQFRFEHGKLKLPIWRRQTKPWNMLFDQIEGFNPDVEDGGLDHDDAIDIIAMSQFILKGRLNRTKAGDPDEKTPQQRLLDGDYVDNNGQHVGEGLDLRGLKYNEIQEILDTREIQGAQSGTTRTSKV